MTNKIDKENKNNGGNFDNNTIQYDLPYYPELGFEMILHTMDLIERCDEQKDVGVAHQISKTGQDDRQED